MGAIPSPQWCTETLRDRSKRGRTVVQVIVDLVKPARGVVDVEEPTTASRDAVRPARCAAEDEVGIDAHRGEDRGIERECEAVLAAQQRRTLEHARRHVMGPEFGKGRPGLIERGHDRRLRKRASHGEHHALGAAALGEVVVRDYDPYAPVIDARHDPAVEESERITEFAVIQVGVLTPLVSRRVPPTCITAITCCLLPPRPPSLALAMLLCQCVNTVKLWLTGVAAP